MRLIIQLIMQPRTARKADRGIAAFYQMGIYGAKDCIWQIIQMIKIKNLM